MSLEQTNYASLLEVTSETIVDAKKKVAEETSSHAKYLRFNQDGTYTVRILPLAPIMGADGKPVEGTRKGYEYPLRQLVLTINSTDKDGKVKKNYVNVINAKYALKDIENDIIDMYVKAACDKYASDGDLCKKIKGGSFDGGLKWNSVRNMYVFDVNKKEDGLQILSLSFSQYKELEDRKMDLWNKLLKKNEDQRCPISSPLEAYPIEIKRKTENKKTGYSFNIDTVSGTEALSESDIEALFNSPRLPEVLYRYNRYHLEATIEFLKQYEEKMGIDVLSSEEVQNAIKAVSLKLPADDNSHFSLAGKSDDAVDNMATLDSLWDEFDKLSDNNKDDRSEEGQELRVKIREFIEDNNLDITVTRKTTNQELLNSIEDAIGGESKNEEAPVKEEKHDSAEKEEEPEEVAASNEEDEEDPEEAPEAPASRRRSSRPQRRF